MHDLEGDIRHGGQVNSDYDDPHKAHSTGDGDGDGGDGGSGGQAIAAGRQISVKRDKCHLSCIRDKTRLSLLTDMKNYPVKTPQQLGAVLQGCRKTQELTQAQVGERVGLPQKEISKLESNPANTSLGRVFKVLAALELEIVVRERGAAEKSSEW